MRSYLSDVWKRVCSMWKPVLSAANQVRSCVMPPNGRTATCPSGSRLQGQPQCSSLSSSLGASATKASPAMVWAKLSLDRLAVVPDRPYLGAAVVVLVADPAAAAVVVLVADDQAVVVLVRVVIAGHGLAAGRLLGHEVDLCAYHRSLPSRMAGELRAAGRRLAGRADHDARAPPPSCTAIMSGCSLFAHSVPLDRD